MSYIDTSRYADSSDEIIQPTYPDSIVIRQDGQQIEPVDVTGIINNVTDLLPSSWIPYWEKVQSIPLLGFLLIIFFGYFISRFIVSFLSRALSQVTKRTKSDADDQLIATIRRPLFLTVFFFFLGVATKSLDLNTNFESVVIKILASIVVFTWITRGFRILNIFLKTLSRISDRYELVQPKTMPLFDLTGKILIFALGSYILLIIWGINPTAWLASAGVIGIAVGFAARDTLANLFSGFFIIADTPYKVGDFINLDSGERGMVTRVGLRSTRILTRDDVEITIPNNVIGNAKIVNESSGRWEKRRLRIKVGAAYGADVDIVCETLMKIAESHSEILTSPKPRVRLRGFGASSLNFELLCWIDKPVLKGKLSHDLYMEIYRVFAANNLEIPYSKQDVYIKELPKSFIKE